MREGYFIGELSERAGVPPQTIRYYEQLGLLEPPDRTQARYRVYMDDHLGRLRFIMQAKAFGLSLDGGWPRFPRKCVRSGIPGSSDPPDR